MGKTILIVEDDNGIRAILQDTLASQGYDVVTAENGIKGWELAKELRPDLVILDVMLPLIDSFEICKRMRKEGITSPVMMLTVKAQLQIGICYEKLGMKEAQTAYRQVIDKYPKQTDVVAAARERLAGIERSLAELNRHPKFRKIEIATKPQNGVLSPEGDKQASSPRALCGWFRSTGKLILTSQASLYG